MKIAYHSGEPFDVAMCACRSGRAYRDGGEGLVRARLNLASEHRVAWLEDFDDVPMVAPSVDHLEAGKTRRVKL